MDINEKCAGCRYAMTLTGRCGYHDLPMQEAMQRSCEDKPPDPADMAGRPRPKPFMKKPAHVDTFLYGFLMTCGAVIFVMAVFLFFFSEDEGWRGIWGVIGFIFLGGLGALCFAGSAKNLKDAYAERRKSAAGK